MTIRNLLSAFTCVLAIGALFASAGNAAAAAVEAKIELPLVRCIKTATPGEGKSDEIYFLVDGVAKGAAVAGQLPDGKALKISPKESPVNPKAPVTVWAGKLEEGEFVAVTVSAFAGGKIDDAQRKAYFEKRAEANKKVEALAGKTLDDKGVETARKALNTANRGFFTAIGDLFPKGKADAHVGAFDVIVANVGGKLVKRVCPTGLIAGEHYGTGVKRYSKIKYTLENVIVKDASGQFYEKQEAPVSDSEEEIRVKMLETVKTDDGKHVTDYLIDVRVTADGKAGKWMLNGDHPGPTIIHDYFDWAE